VKVSSKAEYAVRATIALARHATERMISAEAVAMHADLPAKFLETILGELRNAGIVSTQRGPNGGCRLARPATQISVADVMRAVEGPLADVRGARPEDLEYGEGNEALQQLWIAMRVAVRQVLETTSIADIAAGSLPRPVRKLLDQPGAWSTR
jgi:Rrf2 family protein